MVMRLVSNDVCEIAMLASANNHGNNTIRGRLLNDGTLDFLRQVQVGRLKGDAQGHSVGVHKRH